jgi:atypical dual specificity phosphatase
MFIDVPYWTQLATDAVYSLEQALESKIIGDHKVENSHPIDDNNNESWVRNFSDQVIFHVSLGYNLASHHQVSQPWWTELEDKKIILGALPFHERKHVERLKSLGVGGVLTLNKPFELQPNLIGTPVQPCDWLLNNVESLHIPTPDFCPPSPEEIKLGIEFMKKIINSGKSVYVHCKAGRGRSVVAVVCYLMEIDNMTVEEAIDYVKKRRPQINMGKIQQNICYSYYNILHGIQNTEPIISKENQEELMKECQSCECEGLEDDSLVQDINDEFYLV